MNDEDEMNAYEWGNETILSNGGEWHKVKNGTYTKYMRIHYRDGRVDQHILESNVTEKEYFKRKLDGTD